MLLLYIYMYVIKVITRNYLKQNKHIVLSLFFEDLKFIIAIYFDSLIFNY